MNPLEPLYDLVSWIVITLHSGLTALGLPTDSGWSWSLAIAGLVVLIRTALIPLFVKQIKSMRNMQVLQPQIKKIQEKYKGDRERTSQELMKLYKETGTNPLSSCLPILAQAPFFFALYRVLRGISQDPPDPYGVLTQAEANSAAAASFFGAPLDARFVGAESLTVQIVTVVMIVLMSGSQFITQRQLMVKNLPKDSASGNPFMQQQKVMMYAFPIIFAVVGINFPVGVLLYWLVSNAWSMGQQLFVIRRMPAVGSPAHDAMMARKTKKGTAPDSGGGKVGLTKAIGLSKANGSGANGSGAKGSGAKGSGANGSGAKGSGAKGSGSDNGGRSDAPGSRATASNGDAVNGSGQQNPSRRQPQRVSRSKRTGSKKR